MLRPLSHIAPVLAFVLFLSACGTGSSTEPRELSLTVTPAESSVAVGETVFLDIVAEGDGLISLVVFWGDGTVLDVSLPNVSRHTRRADYAYDAPGVHEPLVRIMERTGRTLDATVTVEVVPLSGG